MIDLRTNPSVVLELKEGDLVCCDGKEFQVGVMKHEPEGHETVYFTTPESYSRFLGLQKKEGVSVAPYVCVHLRLKSEMGRYKPGAASIPRDLWVEAISSNAFRVG